MNRIKVRNKEKVSRYVTDAISLYNPGTTTLSGGNIFKFNRIVYILGNLIDIQGFHDNNDQKRGLISRGIGRFSRYKRRSISLFIKALEIEMKRRERQILRKFFVVFPLNVSYKTLKGKRHFVLGETKLKTRSFAHTINNFDFKRPYGST